MNKDRSNSAFVSLASTLALGAVCALAPAQSATIHLDSDDADGYAYPGQIVTWTLSVSFTGGSAASGGNFRLVAIDPVLESSDFWYTPTNGGNNGGESDGAGGIALINWTNSLFLEGFGGPPDFSNPFTVGTFTTTALKGGVLGYRIEQGALPSPFLTIALTAFSETAFTPEQVGFRVNGSPIGPANPTEAFDSSGSDEDCVEALFVPMPNGPGVNGTVRAMLPLPNGDLVVAGDFTHAGGQPSPGVARWDGAAWHPMGDGIVGTVRALTLMPDGDLIAGGKFDSSNAFGGKSVVRWNGETWAAVGSGLGQYVHTLVVLPTGELVAGGSFRELLGSTADRVAMWDGLRWATLGGGTNSAVRALQVLPSGDLVAAGQFTSAGGVPANYIARWDGAAWSPLSSGMNSTVHVLTLASDGRLLAGGRFTQAGGVPTGRVASWDGSEWSALGNLPPGPIYAFTRLANGDLVAAGFGVHRWDGSTWTTLEAGADGRTLLSTENGELLLGGSDGLKRWGSENLPPRIFRQPAAAQSCPLGGAAFAVYSDGPGALSYQWQVADDTTTAGWRSIENGDDPALGSVSGANRYRVILNDSTADAMLRCVVSNGCTQAVSEPASLLVDRASCCARVDYSGDGVLDSADLGAFIALFVAHYPAADLNRDSVVDLGDVEAFVSLYLAGCD